MNKIYRVIWNSTLMQWVVTSELGRARIKRAVSKSLQSVGLIAALSTTAFATTCELSTLKCQLDAIWSPDTNNGQNGAAEITDGNTWLVTGLDTWQGGELTYKYLTHLQHVINAGYTVSQNGNVITSLPAAGNTLIFRV